jgi:hypothetical protein
LSLLRDFVIQLRLKSMLELRMPENTATTQDAQLILQLYELRREPELRKARRWVETEFWPRTWEDAQRTMTAYGSQENTYVRMVYGYWEMAASLVLRGALDAGLFHDNNQEMYFVYSKLEPFLFKARESFQQPEFLSKTEGVINMTPGGRERLQKFKAGMVRWMDEREKKAKQEATQSTAA